MDYDQKVMRALLIGADGQLGSELRQLFDEGDLVPLPHADLELTNPGQVWEIPSKYRPHLILNAAAYGYLGEGEQMLLIAEKPLE